MKRIQKEHLNGCDFHIDFEMAHIVSIERIIDNGIEKTSFGTAFPGSTKINDNWVFYCSKEKHNELVKEFKEYLAKREKRNGKNNTISNNDR